jgi:hypothetical protein
MSRRLRLILIILLAAVALLSAGAYAYWFFLIRGPLAGDTSHDFGEVALRGGRNIQVAHTFHLTNRLDEPLTIKGVRADCGCVTLRDLQLTLESGESFDLPVTFQTTAGPRSALIHIIFDDGRTQTLSVKAVGRPQSQLTIAVPAIALREDGTAEFEFAAHIYATHDEPAQPAIATSHEALSAEFLGWQLHYRSKHVAVTPDAWKGRVRLTWRSDGTMPEGASATISLPPAGPLRVEVRPAGSVAETSTPTP